MNKYILVVDDEKDAREILDLVLGTLDITVQEVTNGKAALDLLVKNPPLVMILDLEMPQYDGRFVLDEMRKRNIDIPTLIFTSHLINADLAHKLGIAEEKMFQKGSVSMTRLRQVVVGIIHSHLDQNSLFL
jgi:CheY-like chemotaxis protein